MNVFFNRGAVCCVFALALCQQVIAQEEVDPAGRAMYVDLCARCHGDEGQGVQGEFRGPLTGEDSLEQVTRYIEKWMPEENPELCVGEDAERVGRYIFDAFYSVQAQEKKSKKRRALMRMTARQYENAVTDLIGHFAESDGDEPEPGLRGAYFEKKEPGGKGDFERQDARIAFDFSKDETLADKMPAEGFSARWIGSFEAPESGRYKFTIRTDQAARLWVNDPDKPIIDAWVQSKGATEHTGTVRLIGGRRVSVRLEYSSRDQGVDPDEEEKTGLQGYLDLLWTLPGRAPEVMPARVWRTDRAPELFVPSTPLPPDDRSEGYERGTRISNSWDDATTETAIEAANFVTDHLEEFAQSDENKANYTEVVQDFCRRFTSHAFRAPLTEEQEALYVTSQFEEAEDVETAVKRNVLLTLKSPRFLYTDLLDPPSRDYAVASLLSFALWDSLPDEELMAAAEAGTLSSKDDIAAQVDRMAAHPRCRAKVLSFMHQWLRVNEHHDLAKREDLYPGFSEAIASDMRTSLDLFLESALEDPETVFPSLLLSRELYLNERLGDFLGLEEAEGNPFARYATDQEQRAGVLTHPYIMAMFAHQDATSPIHRGVFLVRNILGRGLRPPPEAFSPAAPDLHPGMTTRERIAMQTKEQSCQSCHSLINPLGFTLEQFDATGRLRDTEFEMPVDTSGGYELPDGGLIEFNNARELAEFLAGYYETHQAFAVQLHHYLVKQPISAYGSGASQKLTAAFSRNGLNIRKLVTEIALNAALATAADFPEPDPMTLSRADMPPASNSTDTEQ